VRFRVEEEHWFDHTPLGPQADDAHAPQRPPYSLVGSMEDPGLGPCLWWDG
jgi:DNA-directed RNA polymerase III subunit RPC8